MRLGSGFGLRKIDLGADLGLDIVGADHRFQNVQNAPHIALFQLLHILQLLDVERAAVAAIGRLGALRQQLAAVIEHADRRRVHLGHAGGHQVHDAGELAAVQVVTREQAQHDRGRRLLLFAEEAVLVRQRQVHAGVLHRRQRLDGARQFAFKTSLEGQALLELGHAKAIGFHHFKAANRALGQALRGQTHAQVVDALGRHEDGIAHVGMLVGHVHLGQLGNDGAAVLVTQVGKQHAVVGLAAHHPAANGQRQHQRQAQAQAKALRPVQPGQATDPARHDRWQGWVGNFGDGSHRVSKVARESGTTPLWPSLFDRPPET